MYFYNMKAYRENFYFKLYRLLYEWSLYITLFKNSKNLLL